MGLVWVAVFCFIAWSLQWQNQVRQFQHTFKHTHKSPRITLPHNVFFSNCPCQFTSGHKNTDPLFQEMNDDLVYKSIHQLLHESGLCVHVRIRNHIATFQIQSLTFGNRLTCPYGGECVICVMLYFSETVQKHWCSRTIAYISKTSLISVGIANWHSNIFLDSFRS